jgi:diamine N-acetyltransferase
MRYMIDARHQGKGYGTAALPIVIDLMVERHGCGEIFLGYAPANDVAGRLYEQIGFVPTDEVQGGKIVARLSLVHRC